jgi:hypothetical protein
VLEHQVAEKCTSPPPVDLIQVHGHDGLKTLGYEMASIGTSSASARPLRVSCEAPHSPRSMRPKCWRVTPTRLASSLPERCRASRHALMAMEFSTAMPQVEHQSVSHGNPKEGSH